MSQRFVTSNNSFFLEMVAQDTKKKSLCCQDKSYANKQKLKEFHLKIKGNPWNRKKSHRIKIGLVTLKMLGKLKRDIQSVFACSLQVYTKQFFVCCYAFLNIRLKFYMIYHSFFCCKLR